ncbi:MAG: family 10 glycosylhydrolase [Cyanobacteria bacterium CRU_2_1]|nr:family 10 glycosylhydrolase [Cyanobacteria bacterium RU_5_0]NJR60431.1 family 10 glycosylhydrolase [Cyanobacteria bacterium CRU_2_1]
MPLLTVTRNTFFKKTTAQSASLASIDKFSVNAGQFFEVNYAFRVGQHCFIKLKNPLGTVGKIGYFYLPHVSVEIEEIRAVWLTNVDSDVLSSQTAIQQGLQQLKDLGFNTIYPAVWQKGFTLYPSKIAENFIGSPITPNPIFADRDMLAELVETANSLNLRVIPWFEYGLATLPDSQLEKKHPHLLTLDQNGNKIRIKTSDGKPDHHVWFNPCHPVVQQFMVDLISDVVVRYEVDGIQLDDHFVFPIELGYDSFTKALYRIENRGKSLPLDPKHPDRLNWASAKLTHLLARIFKAIKAKRSDCLLSLSPNPLGFSKTNYLADWQDWEKQGLIEELVLQVYREALPAFAGELDKSEVFESRHHIPTVIGILTGLRVKSIATSTIENQLQEIRQRKLAGVAFFFYETLFNEALSPAKITRNLADLNRLFKSSS